MSTRPDFDATRIAPMEVPAAAWFIPDPLDLSFVGFAPEAFAILERLRAAPHIEQYRKEKDGVKRYITEPFKRFRDDLVVNWVLPNRLDFETEKNVFSRLLKNDFGAGGCHSHLWMSFYRPERRRLTDAQLAPCITPDGFTTGLFVGAYMKDLIKQAKANIAADPARFLAILNPLLQDKNWTFSYHYGTGAQKRNAVHIAPLNTLPNDLPKADGLWIRHYTCRDDVVAMQGDLVGWTIATMRALWAVYGFVLGDNAR